MCSLTLFLFPFVSLLLIETTKFQESINFFLLIYNLLVQIVCETNNCGTNVCELVLEKIVICGTNVCEFNIILSNCGTNVCE